MLLIIVSIKEALTDELLLVKLLPFGIEMLEFGRLISGVYIITDVSK
jgi:hypothetical protein